MEQQDQRNFIIFMVVAVTVLLGYQALVLEPEANRRQAIQEQTRIEQELQAEVAPPVERAATVDEALGRDARVVFDSPKLDGSIRLEGALIDDLNMKEHFETVAREKEVRLFRPEAVDNGYYASWFWIGEQNRPVANLGVTWELVEGSTLAPETPVTLRYEGGGVRIDRQISIDENYLFTFSDSITNLGTEQRYLRPYGAILRHGEWKEFIDAVTPRASQDRGLVHLGEVGIMDGKLVKKSYNNLEKGNGITETSREGGWIGLTDKYWLSALVPDQSQEFQTSYERRSRVDGAVMEVRTIGTELVLQPGETTTSVNRLFAGAKTIDVVRNYEAELGLPRFIDSIDWGMFYFLTKPFFFALLWLQGQIGSFGLAILAFTVLVKIVLFPLYNRSYAAMARMKKLQEPMKDIQERFAADPQRKQQEIMKLYRDEKVNPVAGCLPILMTMPIFFALYKLLFVTIEMRHENFLWLKDLSAPDPTAIGNLFGLLPFAAESVKSVPLLGIVIGIGILPILYGVTMFALQSLSTPPPDPMQRRIIMMLPIVFTFVFGGLAGGLVMYWVWNNILSIGQQYIIMRRNGVETEFDKFIAKRFGGAKGSA
ncbi:MAG: membrane protein insertase YidC [Pseudomonadota bacterium]